MHIYNVHSLLYYNILLYLLYTYRITRVSHDTLLYYNYINTCIINKQKIRFYEIFYTTFQRDYAVNKIFNHIILIYNIEKKMQFSNKKLYFITYIFVYTDWYIVYAYCIKSILIESHAYNIMLTGKNKKLIDFELLFMSAIKY